jgi:hypothetical protein
MFCGRAVEFLKDIQTAIVESTMGCRFSLLFYLVSFSLPMQNFVCLFPFMLFFFVSPTLFTASFFNYNERRISFLPLISFHCIHCIFFIRLILNVVSCKDFVIL